jgi:hypothetical protein
MRLVPTSTASPSKTVNGDKIRPPKVIEAFVGSKIICSSSSYKVPFAVLICHFPILPEPALTSPLK